MTESDREDFADVLTAVFAYYGKNVSIGVLEIYWNGLIGYDLAAIRDALGRHARNPDTGQFVPKIADVEKMLGGSTVDSALVAWSNVDRAVKHVGAYRTVVFDDALIHRVIDEMGGWIDLCAKPLKEWPFIQNEFVARYRAYRGRSETPPYPPKLIGRIEAENGERWKRFNGSAVLIGDQERARAVLTGGSTSPRLTFTETAAHLLESKGAV